MNINLFAKKFEAKGALHNISLGPIREIVFKDDVSFSRTLFVQESMEAVPTITFFADTKEELEVENWV